MLEESVMASPSLFLNDFTVLDFAYVDAKAGIRGDSYYVSAELIGELDDKDFLLDFSTAKKMLKALVDDAFDHKLLVPVGSSVVAVQDDRLLITLQSGLRWEYESPRSAFELFPDSEISAPVIAYHLGRLAKAKVPANVAEVKFTLTSPLRFQGEASFRYTHGLRFHDGNCQRLFHGHRNPVEVWLKGVRDPGWEARLAAEWMDAQFVTASTCKNREALDLSLGRRVSGHPGMAEVEYRGSQGSFLARIPASRVILTEAEPSIETMSELATAQLRAWGLKDPVRVVAYEGLNKGAAFTS
ncbi:MAG TPA: 6-carboxytetrahydropterin synthase [Bdellovibrionota bacterium]|jgi:6-pyruvoyl-tetrahydropterin synthase